jgi:predicted permease
MKTGVFLFFLLILANTQGNTLQLFSVSNSLSSVVQPTGSVSGGTTIYIRGLGFNSNAGSNQVSVGPYPCNIPADGATETTIACITSSTGQQNNIYTLPIIVISNGQQQQLTQEQGSFSYLSANTPIITALYPASAVPGTYVNFYGIHRIYNLGDGVRNMGDVISMLISNSICGRFDITQANITANSLATISCNMAGQQEAGRYQVS